MLDRGSGASDPIHELEAEAVFGALGSRAVGLHDSEVAERLGRSGPNVLAEARRRPWTRMLARQLGNFFSVLLYVAAALCFVAEALEPGQHMGILGVALLAVAVLNAVFVLLQELRAERAMDALARFLPQRVAVRREGRLVEVEAERLVRGDVLELEEGDTVPADARLVASEDLLVSQAPLTGESAALARTAGPSDALPPRSTNLVFAGCPVLRGRGLAVVFATGSRTELGRIATLSEEVSRPPSPLEVETRRMVRVLTTIATVMGALFFAYGVAVGRPLWVNLVFMLGIIVANVPEGLLPTFTLSLAIGGLRLTRRKVLVKSLNAVEALGSVQVICTDKTGTLTRNQLVVTRVVDSVLGHELGELPRRRLLRAALVAGELHVREGRLAGDPLDVALAEAYSRHAEDAVEVARAVDRHFAFDAHKRRAAGLLRRPGGGLLFAVKGAWEALRPMVTRFESAEGGALPASEEELQQVDRTVLRLASRGYRVIAVADAARPGAGAREDQADLERDLVLLGLVCLEDPLRPEVPSAVGTCHRAGVRVIMVTGDHPSTAAAIARRAGIARSDEEAARAMLGDELEAADEEHLAQALRDGIVLFARTTPEQKLKIVRALKRLGAIVAMTGDGVNDAPALKAADVGVAMGERGTDVARESAQVILLDDNFASIVSGIEEGRTVFGNIRKFTTYVLASNGPEIVPVLLYVLLPVPLALTIVQILAVDLGTDMIPAIALGREPPEPETMDRPPRRTHERLLSKDLVLHAYAFLGVIEAGYSFLLFFLVLETGGWSFGERLGADVPLYRSATGITLSAIVLMQIGNLVGRRSSTGSGLDPSLFNNPLLLFGVGLEVVFSWAVLYAPPVSHVLGTGPVPLWVYGLAWLGIPLIFVADLVRKRFVRGESGRRAAGAARRTIGAFGAQRR